MTRVIPDLRWEVANRINARPMQRFLIVDALGDAFWDTLNRGVTEAIQQIDDESRWEDDGGAP